MAKLNVYLCQVNNRFGDQAFLPYSAGMVQAYCQRQEEICRSYDFQPFIFLRENIRKVVDTLVQPAVIGLSCYIWNWEYNKALAESVRSAYPDCLIVMGGPQVPLRSARFFHRHPYVDLLVHHEGEIAFAEILRERLEPLPDYTTIPGLSVRRPDNGCVKTAERGRAKDVNQLPSPYLEGTFDDLMELPFRWNASHETNRGCPYSCSFCDWGSAVFTQLRLFDDDRLERELEWFGRNKVEILYNCDANYGIVGRDYELAKKLAEIRRAYGFPAQFRPSFAKKSNTTVFEIAKVLQRVDLQRGITLSMQSMSDDCLTAIKRRNIKNDNLKDLLNLYRSHDMPTYTELILGLPGETYDSFRRGISRLFSAGQHEGLLIYLCELLPNSEMATPEYRRRHTIRTVKIPMLLGYAIPSDDDVPEYFNIVVETRTMPFADWQRCFLLAWAVQCFHCLNVTQALAIFLWNEFGVEYHDFYEALLQFAADHPELLLGQQYAAAVATMREGLEGTSMGRVLPDFGQVTWYPEEASFLGMIGSKDRLYEEIGVLFGNLVDARRLPMPESLRTDLLAYQKASLVDPFTPGEIGLQLHHDLAEYFEGAYFGTRPRLVEQECDVAMNAPMDYRQDLPTYALQAVRYGRKNNRLRRRARSIRSITAMRE